MRSHFRWSFCLFWLLMLAGCSRGPEVIIVNESNVILSNVVASGSGFAKHVGSIAAGTEEKFRVRPSGESGLRLQFDANGRHIDSGAEGFFENGRYRVTANVSSNLNVSVTSNLY